MTDVASAAFPNITGFNPTFGGPGTSVTIFGSGFTGLSEVRIGNNSGSAIIQTFSDTQIVITVQSNAVTGVISVTANSFTVNSGANQFTVAPQVTGFSPASAPVGTPNIRVDGENFIPGQTAVRFGGVAAAVVNVTAPSQLFTTVPAGAITGPITVSTFAGTGSSGTNFIVTGTGPVITGFSPTSGLPGTPVRIDGGDFTGTTSVKFNGTNAPGFVVTAPTQIHVNVPATATTGPISVTTPLGTATNATNFVVTGAPAISDFSPAGGPVVTPVVINGSRFTGTTNVTFNGTNAPGFSITADTQIHVNVPTGATTGPIVVFNSFGSATSATSFVVGSAPGINDFSPQGGPVGTLVTINGANFQNLTNVNFNGTNATEVTVTSTTQLSAKVPTNATTGPITVRTLTGSATTTNSFIVGAAPSITNFSPYFGNLGATVTIEGENFLAGQTTVLFNGATASNAVVTSATQISAPVPTNATTGPITVFTPTGTNTTSSNFFVTPRIDGFYPTNGLAGATITVGGLNFIGASSVKFNGVNAAFTVNTTSNLFATLPAAATTGPVSVTTPAGIVSTSTNFHVLPAITSLTPGIGPVGTVVTIAGSGFSGVNGVFFNGVSAATFTVDSATAIHATVPAGATKGLVTVTTAEGTATSLANFIVIPAITGFTPGQGGFGTTVTINGSSLNLVTAVRFNGVNAPFTPGSASQMTTTVPAGATTGPIQLVSPDATVASTNNFIVTPTLTGFTPNAGTAGTVVTLTGSGFTNLVDVQFNGANAAFEPDYSESQIRATVPTNATTGFIRVRTAQGIAFSTANFFVLPRIDGFSPASGGYNTLVTIDGAGFDGTINVKFNDTNAAFTVISPSRITATVPAIATTGPIRIDTPFGSAVTSSNFTVVPPAITGFAPASGIAGAAVTITGASFTGATNVQFGVVTAAFTLDSSTQIRATVPLTAATGPLRVNTPAGSALSASNFVVRPAINAFTPGSGGFGAEVTITGSGFTGVTNVQFSGATAAFAFDSPNQIRATVPNNAVTGPIRVDTPAGTASAGSFIVSPIIASFSPLGGSPGLTVTITGTGFGNVTNVHFNGAGAVFQVDSVNQISAIVPATATTGPIGVTTPEITVFSTNNFVVTPAITGFSPGAGVAGTAVTISGVNLLHATAVKFNGTNALFIADSATNLTATLPATATTGPITVNTPSGNVTTLTNFHVLARITGVSPGAAAEQNGVNIYGSGFFDIVSIKFNGTNAAHLVLSPTNIFAAVPGGARSGPITVTTLENIAISSTNFVVLPAIISFSPTNGLTGTSVTINGTSFYEVSGVRFNGVPAAYVTNSTTQVTATVPETAATGPITLTTPDGTATSSVFVVDLLRLGIRPAAVNLVVITWPGAATNYILEATLSLSPTISWTAVTNTPDLVNGQNTVTNSLTGGNRFYRLRK